MQTSYFSLLLCFFASLLLFSCDGKKTYTSPTDAFTQYNEIETVTFSVTGTAACKNCDVKRITALQVEIVPQDNPVTTLSMNVWDGLGSFYFSDLRYRKGADLSVYGRLYYGTGETALEASTEIEVPGDGETVSCVLNF